ncbi:DNA polymerase III subunit beta [Candidatus Sneabacter namystus]|uniref:Beta sliding clamp n=1 Tax=Candidatus Sneabacter namystus TaxID=2601646 RepID=A0A5C0UHT5_9RICK|nr:DNA polymerase III subunit beta [Candidatus Sneabacter namystus]QEK39648.1 DNA polymerase III subunit beta [Candidatus Sneabacter namystus]
MKIVADTKKFATGIGSLLSIVEKANIKPVLSGLLIQVCDGCAKLCATDMDIFMSKSIDVKVRRDGSAIISARMLHDILRKIQDEEVIIESLHETEQVRVQGRNCQFTLSTFPVNQFPSFDNINEKIEFEISSYELSKLLESTSFSISSEETRYSLNGVCIKIEEGNKNILRAASTDCHRLSTSILRIKKACDPFEIILPKKSTEEFLRFAKASVSENLKFCVGERLVSLESSNTWIVSKLVDSKFPDYEGLIPDNNSNTLTIGSEYLSDAISRVSTVTSNALDKLRTVKFDITARQVEISAYGHSYTFAKEVISFSDTQASYQGEDLIIGFSPKYLLDVLRVLGKSSVDLLFGSSVAPVVITDSACKDSVFVVMPVKVKSVDMSLNS